MKKYMSNLSNYNIVPSARTSISHRSECSPYYDDSYKYMGILGKHLPIFVAPMASVIDENNYTEFDNNGLLPIIPRTVPLETRYKLLNKPTWIALGLDEFSEFIEIHENLERRAYICVDIANGHMEDLFELCRKAKGKFKSDLTLMAGNIANPYTYLMYAEAGIDYVRCSIGSGSACKTNDITGIGFRSSLDLIKEIRKRQDLVKSEIALYSHLYKTVPYIVFDGGINSIRDIIVALAAGANYVMCGKIFAKAEEACGDIVKRLITEVAWETRTVHGIGDYQVQVPQNNLYSGRMYYGMSTEHAQVEMGNLEIKPSEGTEFWVKIEYTLSEWVKSFEAAIRSTMSYCNARTLKEFIGKQEIVYASSTIYQ